MALPQDFIFHPPKDFFKTHTTLKHLTFPLGDLSIANKLFSFLWKEGERVPREDNMGKRREKQPKTYTELLYKSNSAVQCINERGTLMT